MTVVESDITYDMVIKEYENGWNPVPFNTREGKAVLEEYVPYREDPPTREQIEEWMPKFKKYGVAQITGLCHRGKFRGLYLNGVDIDNSDILKRLLEIFSLEQLANDGIFVEQHHDNKGKVHLWILSTKPFPRLSSSAGFGVEVKSDGELCNSFPSFHEGGYRYFPVGNSLKIFQDGVDPVIHDNFIRIIDKLVDGNYLNGKAGKNIKRVPIDDDNDTIKWYEGERFLKLRSWGSSKCLKHGITELDDIRALVYAKDKRKCEPSLETDEPRRQLEKICQGIKQLIDKKRANGNNNQHYTVEKGNGEADKEHEQTEDKKRKATLAIEKAKDNIIKLFVDEYKEAHVAIRVKDHLEILPLHSSRFKNWLSRIIYKEENQIVSSSIFDDAIGVLNAEAIFDSGDPIKLNLRVAQRIDDIDARDTTIHTTLWYYDLTNKDHEFIEITSQGWRIVKYIDLILFRRFNNQATQVYPNKDYQPNILDEFVELLFNKNIRDENKEDYRLLLKCYIIVLFIPEIPKSVLLPHGGKGAFKSTIFGKIKDIVDPSIVETLSFPRDKNEFIQQLAHNYVAFYDNISYLKTWISDEICRAVTGSGSSKRQLFTDDDDKIYSFKRCIGINGINLAATKPDLLDRGLQFQVQSIDKSDRLKEETVNKKFEELRPYVLGYILDILVKVLKFRETQETGIEEYPRMADFVEYGEIVSRCMGKEPNKFLDAYNRNTELQIDEIIESSDIARSLTFMMFEKYKDGFKQADGSKIYDWIGTVSALLVELNVIASMDLNIDTSNRSFPKAANILTRRLNEIESTLKERGIKIEYLTDQGEDKHRDIKISKVSSPPSIPSLEVKQA